MGSTDTLIKLHQRMLIHAQCQDHDSPEDVAAEYICRILEGRHQRATVSQAYIDIVRLDSGRQVYSNKKDESKNYELRKKLNKPCKVSELKSLNHEPSIEQSISLDEKMDLERFIDQIKEKNLKKVFLLRLQGFSLEEISKRFKRSASWACLEIETEIERQKQKKKRLRSP